MIHPGPNYRQLQPDEILCENDICLLTYVGCWMKVPKWGKQVKFHQNGPYFRKHWWCSSWFKEWLNLATK